MPTKESIRSAILASATENSTLLVKLSSTMEAPSILQAHEAHIDHLRASLAEQESALARTENDIDSKFKLHKKHRDSTTLRFFYRATHMLAKFEAKAMQQEQEYFAALGSKSRAEERRNVLKKDLDEAVKTKASLLRAAKEHEQAHQRIDALYEKLFAGPTPGFPREDEREEQFYAVRSRNEEVKVGIVKARRAIRLMNMAARNVTRAGMFVRQARSEANNSIIFFDEALYSLNLAGEYVVYALSNVGKAEAVLEPLDEELNEHKRSVMAALHQAKIDVETLSSRTKIFEAIDTVQPRLDDAHTKLEGLIELTKAREKRGLEEIKPTSRQLEDARQALQEIRQQIFEEVAGFGEAAPSYTECCDRADDFCVLPEYQEDEGDGPQTDDDFGPHESRHGRDEPSEGAQHQLREVSPQNKVFTSKDVHLLA